MSDHQFKPYKGRDQAGVLTCSKCGSVNDEQNLDTATKLAKCSFCGNIFIPISIEGDAKTTLTDTSSNSYKGIVLLFIIIFILLIAIFVLSKQ